MQAKQKFIAFAIVLISFLLIIGLVAGFIYSQKDKSIISKITGEKSGQNENVNTTAAINTNGAISVNENAENTNTATEQIMDEQSAILKIAKFFSERFGTYSNENNFSNLTNLKDYMTGDMQAWTDNFIAQNKDNNKDVYYSLVSQAVSANITEYNEQAKTAKVEAITMQKETSGLPQEVVSKERVLTLDMRKEENAWKVNSAQWQ